MDFEEIPQISPASVSRRIGAVDIGAQLAQLLVIYLQELYTSAHLAHRAHLAQPAHLAHAAHLVRAHLAHPEGKSVVFHGFR